jgi:hypothetical protein
MKKTGFQRETSKCFHWQVARGDQRSSAGAVALTYRSVAVHRGNFTEFAENQIVESNGEETQKVRKGENGETDLFYFGTAGSTEDRKIGNPFVQTKTLRTPLVSDSFPRRLL